MNERRRRQGRKPCRPPAATGLGAVGTFLRRLRLAQGRRQDELAGMSVLSGHVFDRTYVARQEAGEFAGSVKRFLTYLRLLHANVNVVSEMIRVASLHADGLEELSASLLMEKAEALTAQGQHDEALSCALAAVHKGISADCIQDQARGLLCAAVVLGNQESWTLSLEFAEQALTLPSIDDRLRGRAGIQLANAQIALGRIASAEITLTLLGEEWIRDDRRLAAMYWHDLGIVRREQGRHEEAVAALAEADRLYDATGACTRRQSELLGAMARSVLDTGQVQRALALAEKGLRLARESGHRLAVTQALIHAGRVHAAAGQGGAARRDLLEAEALARELGHSGLLFAARLWLYAAARRAGERPLEALLRRRLLKDRPQVVLAREEAETFERFFGPAATPRNRS